MTHTLFHHLLSRFHPSRTLHLKRYSVIVPLVAVFLLLTGCAETGQMYDQPRNDPYEASQFFPDGQSARPLPAGVVPYAQVAGLSPYTQQTGETMSPNSPILTGVDADGNPVQGFPVPVDEGLVAEGQERFNIFCIPCHGAVGDGAGKAVPFGVQKPPTFLEGDVLNLSTGDIFNVITNGKGKMFPYGYRVTPEERWAIISYVRALQLKNGAVDPAGLTPADLQAIESKP